MALLRVGLNPDCPISCVHLAGIEFPMVTQRVEGYGTDTKRTEIRGVVLDLDDEQVAAAKAALARKWVRSTTGRAARSYLVDSKTPGWRPFPDKDVPLSRYVYMVPANEDPYTHKAEPTVQVEQEAPVANTRRPQVKDTAPNRSQPQRRPAGVK